MDNIILGLISCEMTKLVDSKNNYKENMDCCIPFSKEYWLLRDKFDTTMIKINYLAELRDRIQEVINYVEQA